jgi:hypothetical protein
LHTQASTAESAQPPVFDALQQLAQEPQSALQVAQSSVGPQDPSPQTGSKPSQVPHPSDTTASTHRLSHFFKQQ